MFQAFGEVIGACITLDSVRATFGREIAKRGYTASACRSLRPSGGDGWHYFFRDCPRAWPTLSDARNFDRRSAVLAEARKRLLPFTWEEVRAGRRFSAEESEVWEAAAGFGWINGFVVPIHGPFGYFACVGMDSPERDLDRSAETRLYLRMIALLAHERCFALSGFFRPPDPAETLTTRERECLRWVAAGKTDWEIGVILGISASTVRFHLDRARGKLGVRTRVQAVARFEAYGSWQRPIPKSNPSFRARVKRSDRIARKNRTREVAAASRLGRPALQSPPPFAPHPAVRALISMSKAELAGAGNAREAKAPS
jgi:LuxR family quorum sensing-dependent transcriptional regulator